MLASRTSSVFSILATKNKQEQEEFIRKQRSEAAHIIEDCQKRLLSKRTVVENG